MRLRILAFLLAAALLLMSGCASKEASSAVVDALGREITVSSPQRVGIASSSLAECWMLAGGSVCAVTQDARERNLELPGNVIDLGGLKNPSLEVILSSNLDLLILMPTLKNHLAMAETLDMVGINYAYFDVENFDDYLELMKLFTDMTGRSDLYEANAEALKPQITLALEQARVEEPRRVLILRVSSGKIKALDSSSMVGQMLKEFGCENIADSDSGLLTDLSLEAIVREDPDDIFISCMGDMDEGIALLESTLAANPIWGTLQAVKNGRCHYLEKELFHYKPNARWGESYEKLAELLLQD